MCIRSCCNNKQAQSSLTYSKESLFLIYVFWVIFDFILLVVFILGSRLKSKPILGVVIFTVLVAEQKKKMQTQQWLLKFQPLIIDISDILERDIASLMAMCKDD